MPANNDYPAFNGIAPSWADVVIKLNLEGAAPIEGKWIKSINTNSSVEVGVQKRGGRPFKRTRGESSHEASMTVYREGYQEFLRTLVSVAPYTRGEAVILRDVHFDIVYQYAVAGDPEIYERVVKNCFVTGAAINGAEGTDPNEVEVPLNTLEIVDVIDGREVVLL